MRRFLVKSNGYKPGALTPYQYIFELNEDTGQLKLFAGNKEYVVNGSGGGGGGDFDPDLYYTISDIDGMDLANGADLSNLSDGLIDGAPELYNTIGKIATWITSNVDNENYATKQFVTDTLGDVTLFSFEVVEELPTDDIKPNSIYLVPNNTSGNNIYDEYIYTDDSWEVIGSTDIDLTGYATEDWVNNQGFITSFDDTVTLIGATAGDAVSGTVVLNGVGATEVTQSGNTITISSTNTNTTYTAGTNISIDGTVISATDTNTEYDAGDGIEINDNVISNSSPNIVQTIDLSGNEVTLSNGGGSITLPTYTDTTYTAGANISIDDNVISATDTNTEYDAGDGIEINDNVIINTAPNVTQILSKVDDTITLSNGGGNVTLSEYVTTTNLDTAIADAITEIHSNIIYHNEGTTIESSEELNNSILLVDFDGNVEINITSDETSYNFVVRNIHETGTVTFTGMTPHASSMGDTQIVGYGMASVIKHGTILIVTNP